RSELGVVCPRDDRVGDPRLLVLLVDEALEPRARLGRPLDDLLDGLDLLHRRPVPRVHRPAQPDVNRPRSPGPDLLDEVTDAGDPHVEGSGDAESVLPRQEAAAERELARCDGIERKTVIAARVGRLAEVTLPVDGDRDVVLEEGPDSLV